MLNIFLYPCWPSAFPLWKNIQVFCPFFNCIDFSLMLSFMSNIYVLDSNPLSVIPFANLFSPLVGCLFIRGFLCCEKVISFHLFIFCFYFLYFRRWIKKKITAIYINECYAYAYVLLQNFYNIHSYI